MKEKVGWALVMKGPEFMHSFSSLNTSDVPWGTRAVQIYQWTVKSIPTEPATILTMMSYDVKGCKLNR